MKKLILVLSIICLSAAFTFAEGSAEGAAAMDKQLNRYVIAKLQPFDPADMTDLYTSQVYGDIGEALYAYNYLADTYVLKPEVAKSMPKVSADGLTYTIEMHNDIYYYDPLMEVFPKGKGRNVMAKDFVLSVKRLADPDTESGGWWLYEGYIKGLDDWAAAGADYSKEVEGFKAIGDYTIQLTLTKPYPQILYTFAMPFTYPVPQELIDYYGDEWKNYPIGSGAYYYDHAESIPGTKHVLRANPYWKAMKFPAASTAGPATTAKLGSAVLKEYEGKELPFCNTVVWNVIEESSVQWLKFLNGELDYSSIPKDNFDSTVIQNELTPAMTAKGITLDVNPTLDVTYHFFNMDHPILGQNTKLRQAMSMAYDHEKALEIFYNNTATNAQTLIPPGLGGYDPNYKNPYATYNLAKAKQLLAEAGYPDGKGLPTFKYQMYSTSSTTHRQMVEFYIENMSKIGIKVEAVAGDWPTFLERIDNHEVELGGVAWGADYPDAQNFLQLNYGPNAAPGPNSANYDNPKFNELYEKGAYMQQSPERDKLYAEAAQIAAEDVCWIMGVHRLSYALEHPWLKTRVFRDIGAGYSKYLDIDAEMRDAK
ncbi:MAG: hypothetical protein JW852_03630 [Spirochaetales bacterium]|nr:hypothetical protein [Spirochaetales bacterium]